MGRIIKIKDKFYDTGTSNKSFLQVAKDLKTAGVKNWYFMLEIKDPSLISVNPYAVDKEGRTTCTKDQISRITIECLNNIWYYLREIARIPSAGCPEGVPYIANRGNIAQTWCLKNGIDSWLCLPRQQGKTKSALSAQTWAYSFGTTSSTFIFINKDADNAKQNLRDFADMIQCLPEYLRYESVMDEEGKITKSIKNATRMQHPVTKNQVLVRGKATSYDSALGMGRGLTAPILHFDESEFTNYIDVIVENSVSTFETASRKSKEAGTIYGRVFTSTPGDIDTDAGKRSEQLLAKTAKWSEEFYDMDIEEIRKRLYADGKMGVTYIEYSYKQIGLTEDWFHEIAAKIGNPLTVRREILLQRLRGSNLSPYDRDDIDRIIDLAKRPIETIMLQKYYELDVYTKLNRNIPYLVGIDCSTGSNGDANAMTVVDPYTQEVVAEFECSYVGEPSYIKVIQELVTKHIPRAILCIERNHVGDAIIAFLLESPIAGRLYFDKYKELAEEKMKDLEKQESILKAQAKLKTYYGVFTEGKSREVMFQILANRIKDHKDQFIGQKVTRDISKLVMKGGKIQAAAGFHDDNIMSYLIAMYVLFYGNNLNVFGFDPGDILASAEKNTGMIAPDLSNLNMDTIPDSVEPFVEKERERHSTHSYEEILRNAIMQNQQRTMQLSRKGLIQNDLYENTPKQNGDDAYYDEDISSNLDFLDELNNF